MPLYRVYCRGHYIARLTCVLLLVLPVIDISMFGWKVVRSISASFSFVTKKTFDLTTAAAIDWGVDFVFIHVDTTRHSYKHISTQHVLL